jgi:uncharacterized membrane protein SpoIIM required for sporulation
LEFCSIAGMKRRLMINLLVFIFLTILFVFSLFEIYNISALYKDQVGMWEFEIDYNPSAHDAKDLSNLNKLKWELNSWRVLFCAYILFYIAYIVRKVYSEIVKSR